jgi:glycosyltransferase involved in cell wall biosynthesis
MFLEKNEQNFVSIVLPTYNRVEYLRRSIDSVINQTSGNWELLIVDDGSSDESLPLIAKYVSKYKNIKYFFHQNRGVAYSMNSGIKNSKGNFITFLGSDDEYSAEHIEERLIYLNKNEKIDLIYSPANIIGNPFVKDKNDKLNKIHLDDCILGGTLFGKAKVFKELNGFKELDYSPESEFVERAIKLFNIQKFNSRSYTYYRDTPGSICNSI